MLKLLLALLVIGIVVIAARIVTGASISLFLRRTIGPSICAMRGHRRNTASVRKSDDGYHARCKRCDIRLWKAGRHDEWKPVRGVEREHRDFSALERVGGERVSHADAIDAGSERGA